MRAGVGDARSRWFVSARRFRAKPCGGGEGRRGPAPQARSGTGNPAGSGDRRSGFCPTGFISDEEGQSTLEYLLVLAGVVAAVIGLYALVRLGEDGVLSRLAEGASSHAVGEAGLAGGMLDVLMF